MIIMADMLSLTREEHCERERIVSELFNMLRPYYPECDIFVFGSSANGFGFKGCDLDLLFMPFPEYCNMVSIKFCLHILCLNIIYDTLNSSFLSIK